MQIIDLFSGIGGFSVAGKRVGWDTVAFVERDRFCQRVLRHHFPEATVHDDIKKHLHLKHSKKQDGTQLQTRLFVEGFPVSPSQQQEKEKVMAMIDGSGRKCLEQLQKFDHCTLWQKTFVAFLIGAKAFYSSRCLLTWKLRATKRHRFYFQLRPLVPRTLEKESSLLPTPVVYDSTPGGPGNHYKGLGQMAKTVLLPTPAANEFKSTNQELYQTQTGTIRVHHKNKGSSRVGLEQMAKTKLLPTPDCSDRRSQQSQQWGLSNYMKAGMLPTPTVKDTGATTDLNKINARREKIKAMKINGNGFGMSLGEMMQRQMLPTPRASEWKGVGPLGSKSHDHNLEKSYLGATLQELTGTSFQLNPRFVSEMMDFPVNYLELPFLNGDKNL